MKIYIHSNPVEAVAKRFIAAAKPRSHIVLTGGSTPRLLYKYLADSDCSFSGTTFWLSDERCVPGGVYSNARMIDDSFGPISLQRLSDFDNPEQSAQMYNKMLNKTFGPISSTTQSFDITLLGLGTDGHIASLFPDLPTPTEDCWAFAVPISATEPYVPRVTLSLPALQKSKEKIFLITGEEKAEAVASSFSSLSSSAKPASLLVDERTHVFLDHAAAQNISTPFGGSYS